MTVRITRVWGLSLTYAIFLAQNCKQFQTYQCGGVKRASFSEPDSDVFSRMLIIARGHWKLFDDGHWRTCWGNSFKTQLCNRSNLNVLHYYIAGSLKATNVWEAVSHCTFYAALNASGWSRGAIGANYTPKHLWSPLV